MGTLTELVAINAIFLVWGQETFSEMFPLMLRPEG